MPDTTVPTEDELKEALSTLRAENPTLGIPKLHALLSSTHPDWSVSEKRTRKVVQSAGLTVAPPGGSSASRTAYPKSSVIKDLDIAKWTTKVEVRNFGKEKGKGLVAKEEIGEGDVIWKEDPWVIGPEWYASTVYVHKSELQIFTREKTSSGKSTTCRGTDVHARSAPRLSTSTRD